MFTILILFFLLQVNLIFLHKKGFQKWRESFLKSVIVLFTTVVFSTEFLSYFYLLKPGIVRGWWIFLNVGLAVYLYFSLQLSNLTFINKFPESFETRKIWFKGKPSKLIWIFFTLI